MQKYLVLVLVFISVFSQAQVAAELSPKSLTLPRLSTSQQNTLPPQQAGNVVFNADEKKLAVHDGNQWNYILGISNSTTNPYKNHKMFLGSSFFTVPSGVTNILIEAWGNGANGELMATVGAEVPCSGGGGGQYQQTLAIVNPGDQLDIVFGTLYNAVNNGALPLCGAANADKTSGGTGFYYSSANIIMNIDGQNAENADFNFQQANVGVFRKIVKGGVGGGTFPTFKNGGKSYTMEFDVNTGLYVGGSLDYLPITDGKFPGGGGGCGCNNLARGTGAPGAIIFHY